jgi:hypothetical protein
MLILILVVVWLLLMGFLAIFTLAFQGYIYTEPVKDIHWRAPVAGSVLALFLTVWVFLDYSSPGNYGTLFQISSSSSKTYNEIRVVTQEGKEEDFKLAKDARGRPVYLKDGRSDGRPPPSRPMKVIVKEGDKDVEFKPDLDSKGHFKTETGQSLYYRDNKGRVMQEGQLGHASIFLWGNLIVNLLLNGLHFVLWFVVLWLVLEFRGAQAFGLAIVFWLAVTLFLLPPMFSKAEAVGYQPTQRTSQ